MSVRGYRYEQSDVGVPPMRDFMIVAYRRGVTDMHRRLDSAWQHEQLGPGDVSLLTRAADSHWMWSRPIEVVHVYLTHDQLASTCRDMYERDVEDVALHDTIKADDPVIHRTAMMIAQEAATGGVGSELLVDSLTCQLSVAILRRHANVLFREPEGTDCLSFREEHLVRDYVQAHLHRRLTLDDLAGRVGLSSSTSRAASRRPPTRRRTTSSCAGASTAPASSSNGPTPRSTRSRSAAGSPTRAT